MATAGIDERADGLGKDDRVKQEKTFPCAHWEKGNSQLLGAGSDGSQTLLLPSYIVFVNPGVAALPNF